MKEHAAWILALICAAADAQVYNCPAEDAHIGLTNAEMRVGAHGVAYRLHGDVDQIRDGTNIHFEFPDEAPRWLVCQYGGGRIEGTAISGPGAVGSREAWIQVDPMVTTCNLAIRASKPQVKNQGTWSATATCKRKEPPPPDLVYVGVPITLALRGPSHGQIEVNQITERRQRVE
jgi:hypothetical protein